MSRSGVQWPSALVLGCLAPATKGHTYEVRAEQRSPRVASPGAPGAHEGTCSCEHASWRRPPEDLRGHTP
eukprot:7390711-Prymnesium_polylepis.4